MSAEQGLVRHPWPPIGDSEARVLVLGTMPSQASLDDGFYFGHKRNAFWPIMGLLFGAHRSLSPAERSERLVAARVAVWDVLASCMRRGASDASIQDAVANDFVSFFGAHRKVRYVLFNGQTARDLWEEHVDPDLPLDLWAELELRVLPSTSPAHARSFEAKHAVWEYELRRVLAACAEAEQEE
jgi:hypoxanthine-DNA glycosylase